MTAAIALAEQHDQAGRHDDAINALARATQSGDTEAMTELGKRLIVGDRAPLLPLDGAKMLLDATVAGNAEAALRFAVLKALGAHMPQSWTDAIGLLVFAAERGSESARKQVAVLARQPLSAAETTSDWKQLAGGIDTRFWQTSPAGPPIWNRLPPSAEITKPPTIAVYRPCAGDAPDAIAIAIDNGNATIATVSPATASARKCARR